MKVDIYDFDKTIIPFDSGSKFFLWCLLHYPYIIFFGPHALYGIIRYCIIRNNFTKMKKYVFGFIRVIPLEKAVSGFWNKYEKKVFPWFINRNRENKTVIISASPDFLLEEIAKRLEIDCLICTRHNRKTGEVIGENCRCDEKVRRFREIFPDAEVCDVRSDSLAHDKYIFSLGKRCFHIEKDGTQTEFTYSEMYKE